MAIRFIKIAGARLFYDTIGVWLTLGFMLLFLNALLTKTKVGPRIQGRVVERRVGQTRPVSTLAEPWDSVGRSPQHSARSAPLLLLRHSVVYQPNLMLAILIYALAGAALGGLDSLGGAVIGGLAVGLIQSVVVSWFFVTVLEQRWMSVLQLGFAFAVILGVLVVPTIGSVRNQDRGTRVTRALVRFVKGRG